MFGEKYCIVHNGVVSTMKNIEGYPYKGECDTEILLSYFEKFGIIDAIPQINGSASVAIFSPTDKNFYLYKHISPLYILYLPEMGLAFSSIEAPLKKLGSLLEMKKLWGLFIPQFITEMEEGQLFTFNVDTKEYKIENIKVESESTYYYKS